MGPASARQAVLTRLSPGREQRLGRIWIIIALGSGAKGFANRMGQEANTKAPELPAHFWFLFEELGISDLMASCAGQCNFRLYLAVRVTACAILQV